MTRTFSKAALAVMAKGITLLHIADAVGVTRPAVSMQLNGTNGLRPDTLIAVRALGGTDLATAVEQLAQHAFDERRAS